MLLAAIAAIVAGVIAVVVFAGGGGGSHKSTASPTASSHGSTAGTSSTASRAPKATESKRFTLIPSDRASKAIGVAAVLSEGNTYAFYLAAEHLPPSQGFFYAVWLYNSPTSYEALSRSPPVGSDGRLQGGALLPANAGNYREMILTKETGERPTRPGPIILRGGFGLH